MKQLILALLVILALTIPACLHATPVVFGLALQPDADVMRFAANLEQAHAVGFRQVRIRADWPHLQSDAKSWHFNELDAAISSANTHGLEVILVFGPTPRWSVSYLSNPSPEEVARAHPNLDAYRAYVSTVVRRYQHQVKYYQLWERPTSGTLLAAANDVYALYRTGAKAVHRIDPSVHVIAAEPGDMDLGWMADYLHGARGDERADILTLAPEKFITTPEALWWRTTILREQVLPRVGAPDLWVTLPLAAASTPEYFRMTVAALLQNCSHITYQPAVSDIPILADLQVQMCMRTVSTLNDCEYTGWSLLGRNIPAGVFSKGTETRILALPPQQDMITLLPESSAIRDGVAAPDGTITIMGLDTHPRRVAVTGETPLPVSSSPCMLVGIRVPVLDGTPAVRPEFVMAEAVSLDPAGMRPGAIWPLHDLPGGGYATQSVDGRPVLCTERNTAPWLHFAIPDGFMYYNIDRRPVEVIIKVYGVHEAQKSGYSLYYDGIGGMMNSPWQWIDVGPDKVFSYTMRLNDAEFADREGYDLRVSMGGSTEPLRLVDIRVRKL